MPEFASAQPSMSTGGGSAVQAAELAEHDMRDLMAVEHG
jgi:hypothetical protein